jgi:hypothetical protein
VRSRHALRAHQPQINYHFESKTALWTAAVHHLFGLLRETFRGVLYYVLIGGASLPYVNAAEVRPLTGRDPKSPNWIDAHAAGLVSILLPGLAVSS